MERQKFALRELFRSYNNAPEDKVKVQVDLLVARLDWAADIPLVDEDESGGEEVKMGDGEVSGREKLVIVLREGVPLFTLWDPDTLVTKKAGTCGRINGYNSSSDKSVARVYSYQLSMNTDSVQRYY